MRETLPEFGSLRSDKYFIECFFFLTLGKEAIPVVRNGLCRVTLDKERDSGSEKWDRGHF
jgi:hypothetical protein